MHADAMMRWSTFWPNSSPNCHLMLPVSAYPHEPKLPSTLFSSALSQTLTLCLCLTLADAAGFGALLHWRVGLRLPCEALIGLLSLSAVCCAGLGLAVGALTPTADAALALGIPVMLTHMMVGVLNPAGASSKPSSRAVCYVRHASPIRWGIRGLCCAELRGMALDPASFRDAPRMGGLALVRSGDVALERLGLAHETSSRCAAKLAQTLCAELCVALMGLRLTRPRFQALQLPST